MNHWSWECRWWRWVWSVWWHSPFRNFNQADITIGRWNSILAQRPQWKVEEGRQESTNTTKTSKLVKKKSQCTHVSNRSMYSNSQVSMYSCKFLVEKKHWNCNLVQIWMKIKFIFIFVNFGSKLSAKKKFNLVPFWSK